MPEKRNLSTSISFSSPQYPTMTMPMPTRNKKLRRLPHVFSKVLELPFDSDTDVSIEDRPDCLRFVAQEGDRMILGGDVRAHVVEVHPGVTKVIIRRRENRSQPSIDELELNVWRFRLPATARPELARAVYVGTQLVVTVPKNGSGENNTRSEDCKGGLRGNMGNLILVQ